MSNKEENTDNVKKGRLYIKFIVLGITLLVLGFIVPELDGNPFFFALFTIFGSALIIPSVSFHSHISSAFNAAPTIVAV